MGSSLWATILYRPLFNLLLLIYKTLNAESIGWAVIVLIIAIRLLLWPLFSKSVQYQKIMQQIQPELKEIQKKFKGNLEAQGKATMEVYHRYKLHPASYFLLILVQIPVFVGLAGTFYNIKDHITSWPYSSIHLESVPNLSFLGIDLAAPNLLLLIIALSLQFLQSLLIATPSQRKSLTILIAPLIIGFVLHSLPSAFFLYWGVTSLFSIVQQEILRVGESKTAPEKAT